ncbi:MAG: dienelactone hydrolase family protein [Streptosporangiales bacterium]|nr:dienelactone hydrolase family protein [Streptosporangiales bacterium]MBO0891351.1 dienelactone hydrolase family protein [Acidothermales bacterium]
MDEALTARTITIQGHQGDEIEAYLAEPAGTGQFGGVVVIHHMPGYDSATKEMVRRFAAHGYNAICPNLHYREAPGASPDDASAATRAAGGVPDDRLVGDVAAAADHLRQLKTANGKVGVIGHCSGGRQAFLAACTLQLDAAVDCYGAFVVGEPPAESGMKVRPVLDKAPELSCPLLGLFGVEDRFPSPDQVKELDEELTRLGKQHEFHSYDDAGHAFFAVDRPSYRVHAANDGWEKVFDFFGRYVAS